jgi:hypothetical protein
MDGYRSYSVQHFLLQYLKKTHKSSLLLTRRLKVEIRLHIVFMGWLKYFITRCGFFCSILKWDITFFFKSGVDRAGTPECTPASKSQFKYSSGFNFGKHLLSFRPPQQKSVNHKIAGFVAADKKERSLAAHRLQNAARHNLFFGPHII